jgi:aminoglycoside phosphotransferase (APT) family kinase protein
MNTDHPCNGESPTQIFGLPNSQLEPIVERIAGGEAVASFSVSLDDQLEGHQGYGADKLLPTFAYKTCCGQHGRETVFVKCFHNPDQGESRHYHQLTTASAPIPRWYGAVTTQDGREVIFLEYLHPVVDFMGMLEDEEQFRQFLSVTAHFNAISPPPEYAAALPRRDFGRELAAVHPVLDRIWAHADSGEIGDDLHSLCSGRPDRLDALRALATGLVRPIADMEVGLLHNDLYPDSVAWRRDTGELLVVDLESIGLGPRFYDVARWLGAPDELQTQALARTSLAEHYLGGYEHWSGRETDRGQFLTEARLLWLAGTLTMLFFFLDRSLDGRMDWTDDREEGRRQSQDELHGQLNALLREAGRPA